MPIWLMAGTNSGPVGLLGLFGLNLEDRPLALRVRGVFEVDAFVSITNTRWKVSPTFGFHEAESTEVLVHAQVLEDESI